LGSGASNIKDANSANGPSSCIAAQPPFESREDQRARRRHVTKARCRVLDLSSATVASGGGSSSGNSAGVGGMAVPAFAEPVQWWHSSLSMYQDAFDDINTELMPLFESV
jgi:hypothetical protein